MVSGNVKHNSQVLKWKWIHCRSAPFRGRWGRSERCGVGGAYGKSWRRSTYIKLFRKCTKRRISWCGDLKSLCVSIGRTHFHLKSMNGQWPFLGMLSAVDLRSAVLQSSETVDMWRQRLQYFFALFSTVLQTFYGFTTVIPLYVRFFSRDRMCHKQSSQLKSMGPSASLRKPVQMVLALVQNSNIIQKRRSWRENRTCQVGKSCFPCQPSGLLLLVSCGTCMPEMFSIYFPQVWRIFLHRVWYSSLRTSISWLVSRCFALPLLFHVGFGTFWCCAALKEETSLPKSKKPRAERACGLSSLSSYWVVWETFEFVKPRYFSWVWETKLSQTDTTLAPWSLCFQGTRKRLDSVCAQYELPEVLPPRWRGWYRMIDKWNQVNAAAILP